MLYAEDVVVVNLKLEFETRTIQPSICEWFFS
jgi:hypothetical protein